MLGAVSSRVAANARCPVAVVPPQGAPSGGARRVVAGVSATHSCRAALEFAFEEARLRDATLTAVSALRNSAEGPPTARTLDVRTLSRGTDQLAELDSAGLAYPDVLIEPTVSDDRPTTALLAAARDAQLLIVGRHTGPEPSGRLDALTSALAGQAPCPVAVVGHSQSLVATGSSGVFATNFAWP